MDQGSQRAERHNGHGVEMSPCDARHYKGRVRRGRPNPDGSLFHLANHYQALGEQEKRTYWIGKQASLMEKKLFEHPATMLEGLLRRGRPGRLPAAQASARPGRGTGQERKRRLEECCDATT